MKKTILTFAIAATTQLWAQKDVYLTIAHKLGAENFAFNQPATNNLDHNFEITRVDYYMSSIKIIHDGGQVLSLHSSKHLLVKGDNLSVNYLGNFDVQAVEGITFSIGVHPSLNNADPTYQPINSPLYFQTPTMHWGWSAGYFFVCLEGKCGTTLPLTFQLHGLWNQNYFEQTVDVAGVENSNGSIIIPLNADYREALKNVNINNCPSQHGTNQSDLTVLQNFRDFVFSAGSVVSLGTDDLATEAEISFSPNPASDVLTIHVGGIGAPVQIDVLDLSGRIQMQANMTESDLNLDLSHLNSGLYLVRFVQNGKINQSRFIKL